MRAPFAASLLLAFLAFPACIAASPSSPFPVPGREARCAERCRARAGFCTEKQCARGCRFVLDRLVEKEGEQVIACVVRLSSTVARSPRGAGVDPCGDPVFAECAVRSGPYADGGPAPPRPPSGELIDEDEP
jgi:hypothetical protein